MITVPAVVAVAMAAVDVTRASMVPHRVEQALLPRGADAGIGCQRQRGRCAASGKGDGSCQ
jgi:hypothetical protein